jgi:molybdate transport system substrate-binding protein
MTRGARAVGAVLATGLLLTACTAARSEPDPRITVFAAASLRPVFTALAQQYEQASGTAVVLEFGGSADLVARMAEGARADVLATADTGTMDRSGLPGAVPFATNTMAVVVPPDNPARLAVLPDLARPGVRLVVCAPQVPCGAAAARVAQAAGLAWQPVSEPNSVSDVLGTVVSGEADAGVVYRTDALAAGAAVAQIPVPDAVNTTNRYPIAAATGAGAGFVAFVTGPAGRQELADAGFGPP